MRRLGGGGRSRRAGHPPPPASPSGPVPTPPGSGEEDEVCDGFDGGNRQRRRDRSRLSECCLPTTSAAASSVASPTINLSREYMLAVNTSSYKEIWYEIHCHRSEGGEENSEEVEDSDSAETPSSASLISRVLKPDQASVEEALRGVPPDQLTRLVADYFQSSEHSSHYCISLRRAVARAYSLYAPIEELIELISSADSRRARLTNAQCDWAFDMLLEFDRLGNPFPPPSGDTCSFQVMRGRFSDLKKQLELRLLKARQRRRLLRRSAQASGACLIFSTVSLGVTGLYALVVLMAGPSFLLGGCLPTRDSLARPRRRIPRDMAQLDAASRGAYVLNNDLDTIERLVARLHANVEGDRELVRLGLENGGRDQQHLIVEVVRQLRRNLYSFLHQLEDLEEHICLFLAAVNRARSLLLRQIQQRQPPP
ncbi:UPF0496 protein At3g19330-like [Curcuma longa]|uniref:UPF0496 protein At3g19330-like n=1 Tax=Curcuma longa TaxID=136217 RepID=UPI003D9EE837